MSSTSANATLQRRSSRSNSTSSSVVTVKKAASLSSRSAGSRTPRLKPRPASPEQLVSHLNAVFTTQPGKSNRPSRSRPNSAAENKTGSANLNINRWSHSTNSSTSAVDNAQSLRRSSDSSRRISVGTSSASTLPPSSTNAQLPTPSDPRPEIKQPLRRSPLKTEPPTINLPTHLPQNQPLSGRFYYESKASTPSSGSVTPLTADLFSTPLTGPADYFGGKWGDNSHVPLHTSPKGTPNMHIHYPASSPPRRIDGRVPKPRSHPSPSSQQTSPNTSRWSRHARYREQPTHGSTSTASGNSMSSTKSEQVRAKGHRSPTQKTMLSKALTKANTAVLLDNAQNFQGAAEAYSKACDLLQQVMIRSSDIDDRKKLSAIHSTYATRIAELREADDPMTNLIEKELPEMPPMDDLPEAYYDECSLPIMSSDHSRIVNGVSIPPRLESMLPQHHVEVQPMAQYPSQPHHTVSQLSRSIPSMQTGLVVPMQSEFLPSPLSPRKPPAPQTSEVTESECNYTPTAEPVPKPRHSREESNESTSWLDTVDESASSASSSRLSSIDYRPVLSGNLVDEIEAELDAALNAEVETAYYHDRSPEGVKILPRPEARLDLETKAWAGPVLKAATASVSLTHPFASLALDNNQTSSLDYFDDEAEEEERLLEEYTKGYAFENFHFDTRSKSALPRQSDSSGFSGRTWGSSVASTNLTSGTTLSTLAEATEVTPKAKMPPMYPPPEGALPAPPVPASEGTAPLAPLMPPPPTPSSRPSSFEKSGLPGVRDRRMSGQNAKQLKIETYSRNSAGSQSAQDPVPMMSLPSLQMPVVTEQSNHSLVTHKLTEQSSTSTLVTAPVTPMTSVHSGDSFVNGSPTTTALTHAGSQSSLDESGTTPGSPAQLVDRTMPPPTAIRQNVSSSSLKMRNLSIATTAETTESPITPGSASFLFDRRKGPLPPVPTPTGHTFHTSGQSIGGLYLFDDEIGTPNSPMTPRTPAAAAGSTPQVLEPCPDSFLLRPFWLMRCLYQSIAHPRGGYVTTKLFVPRDIWRVKNVKLKAIDEKIGQCDLLTAALLKIEMVDHLDADAVLDELQSFETTVMEQARVYLQKKLGGDVGLSGSSSLFKGSPSTEGAPEALESKGPNSSGSAARSFASSWRKLRSKSSATGIGASGFALPTKDSSPSLGPSLATLPMTSSTNPTSSRQSPRRVPPTAISLSNMGSNTHYMGALARLFDAAQVIDQIARQVEDPGLKCSSKTHVGLELSVRAAAEFFAFYILRFVLADVGVLVDKFVKRGSEWVLA